MPILAIQKSPASKSPTEIFAKSMEKYETQTEIYRKIVIIIYFQN